MDYDDFAKQYATTRWAVPWIIAPLARQIDGLGAGAVVVEVGCGTGNYVVALADMFPACEFKGFDLSREMLGVARSRSERVQFLHGNADAQFPLANGEADFAYLVDVVHHLQNLDNLFSEAARVLQPTGTLIIVTDTEANIRNRSLTEFFPEILEIELKRYPTIEALRDAAERAGMRSQGQEPAEGLIVIDDAFIAKLEQKNASAMRLIAPEAHREGIARVRAAQDRGESWRSCYTALTFSKR